MLVNSSQSTVRSAPKAGHGWPGQTAIKAKAIESRVGAVVSRRKAAWNERFFILNPPCRRSGSGRCGIGPWRMRDPIAKRRWHPYSFLDTRNVLRNQVNVRRDFKRLTGKAGVTGVSLHDLRRSCLTNWARCLPVHVVRELAGHADITTTQQFYLSVTVDDLLKAREVTANALLLDAR